MSIWFHGTNKQSADIIFKKGFKKGTYFAQHLESSMVMGGKYVFWVWFEKDPTQYWEYVCNERIPSNKILLLRKYSTHKIYFNKELSAKIRHTNQVECYGKNIKPCKTCDGKGELNNREYDECANRKYGTVCPNCKGFGHLKKIVNNKNNS